MIPFNNFENSNETPVTDLSKRLFLTHVNEKARMSTIDPVIYMDESANQEPPSFDAYSNVVFPSYGDDHNSCSSGYYSNSSASAPSTCNLNSTSKQDQKLTLDNLNIKTIADPYQYKLTTAASTNTYTFESNASIPTNSYKNVKLRRCHSTSWLSKRRNKRDAVPIISRIIRRTSLNPQQEKKDLFSEEDVEKTQIISTLLTVPEHSTTIEAKSGTPGREAKRVRLSSISNSDMDSTQIISSTALHSIGNNITSEWSRHQSTPTSRFKRIHQQEAAVSPLSSRNFVKPILSRFHSVPVPQNVNSDAQIGDMLPASLPVVDKTSSGLNCISAHTLNEVISGKYSHKNIQYTIVDCRFPYEYDGGHIRGAKNLYTQDKVLYNIFTQIPARDPKTTSTTTLNSHTNFSYFSLANDLNRLLNLDDDPDERMSSTNNDLETSCDEDYFMDQQHSNNNSLDESSSISFEMTAADELHHDILQASMNHSRTRHSSTNTNADFTHLLSFSACNNININNNNDVVVNISQRESHKNVTPVIIFHCEFSSQRAPSLATFLRSIDRTSNFHRYPFLYFPEIYILKGGYSEFFKSFPNQCTPRMYRSMFDKSYQHELAYEKRMTKGITEACMNLLRNYKDTKSSSSQSKTMTKPGSILQRSQTINQMLVPSDGSDESSFKRMLLFDDEEEHQCCNEHEVDNGLNLVHQVIRLSRNLVTNHHRRKFTITSNSTHNQTDSSLIASSSSEEEDKENVRIMMPPIIKTPPPHHPNNMLKVDALFKSFDMTGTPTFPPSFSSNKQHR